MALIGKANVESDGADRVIAMLKQLSRALQAAGEHICIGWRTGRCSKASGKVVQWHLGYPGKIGQRNGRIQIRVNVVGYVTNSCRVERATCSLKWVLASQQSHAMQHYADKMLDIGVIR